MFEYDWLGRYAKIELSHVTIRVDGVTKTLEFVDDIEQGTAMYFAGRGIDALINYVRYHKRAK